jgi:hypothetical protein
MTTEGRRYKKSSHSSDSNDCVEIASSGDFARDSKNTKVELHLPNLNLFVAEAKAGRFDRPKN